MSIWSAAGVAPAFGGQRCGVYLSMIDSTTGLSYLDSHLGQVVDVSIEVFDVYGNVSEKSGQVQFYAPPQ